MGRTDNEKGSVGNRLNPPCLPVFFYSSENIVMDIFLAIVMFSAGIKSICVQDDKMYSLLNEVIHNRGIYQRIDTLRSSKRKNIRLICENYIYNLLNPY